MEIQAVTESFQMPNPKLAELSQKAKVAEQSSVNLMEPGQKSAGKKRGRPPGTTKKEGPSVGTGTSSGASASSAHDGAPIQSVSSSRIAEPLVKLVSKAGAAYVGDKRAEMTASELNDVAESLGMVMDKWMPLVAKDYGPEFLLVSAFTAYGIRIAAMKKVLDEDRKRVDQLNSKPLDPEKPIASQLAIDPFLQPQGHNYISPTIGL